MGSTVIFSARQRIRRWKSVAGAFHLLSVAGFVLCILWALPFVAAKSDLEITQEWKERQDARQMLMEALDRLVRYQHYFHDINGRYTRDLSRLSLPPRLASGDLEQLRRFYEISVIETQPKRFLLLATGVRNTDRVTIDESHRLNANFAVPPPTRAYLLEEADRLLGLRAQGLDTQEGVFSQYWQISRGADELGWVALGVRQPVMGERREFDGDRALASIFQEVSERVKSKMNGGPSPASTGPATASPPDSKDSDQPGESLFKEVLAPTDVQEWLESARLGHDGEGLLWLAKNRFQPRVGIEGEVVGTLVPQRCGLGRTQPPALEIVARHIQAPCRVAQHQHWQGDLLPIDFDCEQ